MAGEKRTRIEEIFEMKKKKINKRKIMKNWLQKSLAKLVVQ